MFSFFFDSYHAIEADFGFRNYEDNDNEPSYRYRDEAPHTFRCKYCGKDDLRFERVNGKYVPYENGKPHECDFSKSLNAGD